MNRKELADAMIKGLRTAGVKECDTAYVSMGKRDDFCRACALGAALIGKYEGDLIGAHAIWREASAEDECIAATDTMARLLSIPESLAEQVEAMHCAGEKIASIAEWLNSDDANSPEELEEICQEV